MKKLLAVIICVFLLGSIASAESATAQLQELYSSAELLMATGNYSEAADKFDSLGAYSDSSQMAMYCKAVSAAEDLGLYDIAVSTFTLLDDFRDSKQMALYYTGRGFQAAGDECNTETASDQGLEKAVSNYKEAIAIFGNLALFKDSLTRYKACEQKIKEIAAVQQDRQSQALEAAYQTALSLEADEKYTEALTAFKKIISYKDSTEHIEICNNAILEEQYQNALGLETEKKYTEALAAFKNIKSYKDSEAHIETCNNAILEEQYQDALRLEAEGQYREAMAAFKSIISYKDSDARFSSCYQQLILKEFPVYTSRTNIEVNDFRLHGATVFGMSLEEVKKAEKSLGNELKYWDGMKSRAHYYLDKKDEVEGLGAIIGINYYFDNNDRLNCVEYRISYKLTEDKTESKYKETGSVLRQKYGEPAYIDDPDAFILPQDLHKNGIGIPEKMSEAGITQQYEQWVLVLADGSIISIVNKLVLNNDYSSTGVTLAYFTKEQVDPVLQTIMDERINGTGK